MHFAGDDEHILRHMMSTRVKNPRISIEFEVVNVLGKHLWTIGEILRHAQRPIHWDASPPSNSHDWDYYIFSKGSVYMFTCHCYWVGEHTNPYVCIFSRKSSRLPLLVQDATFYKPKPRNLQERNRLRLCNTSSLSYKEHFF